MGLCHPLHPKNGLSWCWILIMQTTVLATIMFNSFFSFGCPLEEYEALLEFKAYYNRTSPPSWGKQRDCCRWEGVVCGNSSTRRVSELQLSCLLSYEQGTDGFLYKRPQSWQLDLSIFSSFCELQHLDLSENYFTGSLSSTALVGLKKLKILNLEANELTGGIPTSLGYLTSLAVLNLGYNKLTGSLPFKVFRGLKNLRELQLQYNNFNGRVPQTLGNISSLQYVDLSHNFLEGTTSEQLFTGLVSLRHLDLSHNYLRGKFRLRSFANMSKLEGIVLSNNKRLEVHIDGRTPIQQSQLRVLMLSNCKLEENLLLPDPNFLCSQHHLEAVDLSDNNLTGNIPACLLNNNTKMKYLNLRSNLLTGPIHLPKHPIKSMNTIDASANLFGGSIPLNIGVVFPNLLVLNFSSNYLTGNIPSSFANMGELLVLDLSDNHITGEVPAQLMSNSTSSAISVLKLSNNKLHGKIRNVNFTSDDIRIYLDGNMLSGTLPSNFLGNISLLDVHDNNLDGSIPETISGASSLNYLILKGNHFHGQIPQRLCNLTDLAELDLSYNNFSGSLPFCFPPSILYLNLANNALIGKVPSVLFNFSQLVTLDISKNHLSGPIPTQIGRELEMNILVMRGNSFDGPVPTQLCNLQNLRALDLSHNKFAGSIPSCLGAMAFRINESPSLSQLSDLWSDPVTYYRWNVANMSIDLSYTTAEELNEEEFSTKGHLYEYQTIGLASMILIDLSANKLTGIIPPEIGNLSGLVSLNLSYNQLIGPIPEALSNLDQIESLDLSNNRLSGDIPWQLGQLMFLEVFFVAQNNLSGCIPSFRDQLATFSEATYEGNVGLHGPPLDETCTSTSDTAASLEEENKGVSSFDQVIFYAISTTGYIGGLWASIAIMLCNCWGRKVRRRLDDYVDFLFGEISMVANKLISMNRGGSRKGKNHT